MKFGKIAAAAALACIFAAAGCTSTGGSSMDEKSNAAGAELTDKERFDAQNVFGQGAPNTGYAQYFIGNSYLNPLEIGGGESPIVISNVTFEPGCRNNWHIHHASSGGGQMIICTAGSGWYQLEGQEPVSMEPGDIAYFPAGVKHWHGAKADSWFSHLAFEVPGTDTSNEWLEPVTDEVYSTLK